MGGGAGAHNRAKSGGPDRTGQGLGPDHEQNPDQKRGQDKGAGDRGALTIFWVFLRLGLTSFGGPVAHLGYFRTEFVARRRWISEQSYADLVALCQFLPGPASSQVGLALGLSRGGVAGAFAAWLGFTAPSALVLILFALGLGQYQEYIPAGVIHGLKTVAVAVVAQAVWGMARSLCPDRIRQSVMLITAIVMVLFPSTWGQVGVIVLAGVVGLITLSPSGQTGPETLNIRLGRRTALLCLAVFLLCLIGLPLMVAAGVPHVVAVVDAFFRAGALVFGGGHVVLPLLQSAVVPSGWVEHDVFLAGYGATQAMPGPLFTFAAFLGAAMGEAPTGWLGGGIALVAIFAPSFLLVFGALPFWDALRRQRAIQAALMGVNAAVVGLLIAAFYDPVWTSAIHGPWDLALGILALAALMVWQLPPWLVVLASALGLALWDQLGPIVSGFAPV